MTDQQAPPSQGYAPRGSQQSAYLGPGHQGHHGHPGLVGHQGHPGYLGHTEHPGHDKYSIDSGSTGGYVPPPHHLPQRYRQQSIATSRPSMDVTDLVHGGEDSDFNAHMPLAVFATTCCCLPIGILAISKSQDAKLHYDRGDIELAHYASLETKKYSYWAMAVGTTVFVTIAMAIIIILSYYL